MATTGPSRAQRGLGASRAQEWLSSQTREENAKKRRFHFRVSRISSSFSQKIDKFFFEFVVGGVRREIETQDVVDIAAEENVREADGTVKKQLVNKLAYQKRFEVLKLPAGRYFTLCHSNIRPNVEVESSTDTFAGVWQGSYNDLFVEALVVRVWRSKTFGANQIIGEIELPLVAIADSKIERRLQIFQLNDRFQPSKEVLCTISLKMEFQEAFNFNLNFHNWVVDKWPSDQPPGCGSWFCCTPFEFDRGAIKFKLRRSRISWSRWLIAHMKACLTCRCFHGLTCCPLTCLMADENVAFVRRAEDQRSGPNRATVPYRGAAAWLENDNLEITLRQGCCLWCSRSAGSVVVPLQGALDSTHLTVELDNLLYESCFDWAESLCFPASYLKRTRNSAWRNTRRPNFRQRVYQVSGHVSVQSTRAHPRAPGAPKEPPKWPRFRQLGNADPLRTGPAQMFVGPKDVSTFLVIKVRRGHGLSLEEESRTRINPHVEVEWRGVKKATRTVSSEGNPSWEEELFFVIPDYQCRNSPPREDADFSKDMRQSPITFSIWDTMRHDVRPLGFCELGRSPKVSHLCGLEPVLCPNNLFY